MAERTTGGKGSEALQHELGTHGDQDILKGPPAADDAEFVTIGSVGDVFEADLVASALDQAGITVAARAQKDHLLDPLVDPAAPSWAIQVPVGARDRAREILESARAELRAEAAELARAAEEEELAGERPPYSR